MNTEHKGAYIFLRQRFYFLWIYTQRVRGRLLEPMVVLFSVFQGNSIFFFTTAVPIMKQCTSIHFSPYPSKHLLSFVIQLVTDVRGYHTVVLICISLIRSDVEHLFLCLSSLGISTSIICIYKTHFSFLDGHENSGSLWRCSALLRKIFTHSYALTFLCGRNHEPKSFSGH